ncbi:MAG: hypothetical protein HYY32_05150 [Chloroflexi bacterium]|nr:hypothetical protein [Chloroflexota bacterium]
MFEPNRFDTDMTQDLLEELCEMEMEVTLPSSVIPDEVHAMMEHPLPFMVTEGPWPYSTRAENWAS